MLNTRGFALLFAAASIAGIRTSPAQEKPQLTARELFYAATKPAAAAPAKSAPAKSTPKATPRPAHTPPKPVEIAVASQTEQRPDAGVKVSPTAAQTAPMPANGQPPLGLRINVLRYNSDGTTTDVLPDTIFHSGDRFRVGVEPNAPGFLYIANRGASGIWKAMFPSPEIENGDNRAEAMHPYVIPAGRQVFSFDATAGTENLFVVFSRQPVADFEQLIYTLGSKKPAASDAAPPLDKNLIMAATIGDPVISQLRSYSRDLIIETVNTPSAEGAKHDTAVYVVNPTGSPDSRVVADVKLVHQ
jgi:hypothetical protein